MSWVGLWYLIVAFTGYPHLRFATNSFVSDENDIFQASMRFIGAYRICANLSLRQIPMMTYPAGQTF